MRHFMLGSLLAIAVVGGCVGSQGSGGVGRSGLGQAESGGIDAVFSHPSPDSIPGGQRGEQIRLGYQLVVHTQEFAASYVGNGLTCANCHLDAGLDPNSASYVGLSRAYPEYRARAGRVVTLADRINECFERNLNGKPIPQDSHKLQAIVAYIEWLSKDVPADSRMAWRGIPTIQSPKPPDAVNGVKVFTARCAFCHGADGQGTMAGPPLWGPQSYTLGAELALVPVAAAFIKSNMPRTRGWALSDQDAYDVAAYINAQPRPDFPDKGHDWPKGGKPADVPY
ncbi:MAG: c-type cytochrome [Nitrospira sp.]|uniref:Quinol-cytochrome c reductase, cytochrome c subunit n=1 Tax=Nitrospira defluvii TaxID=330214 RepID=A0ABN7LNH6_9BACT|nr:c-type cytochrome [Nitrospira defluvii]MCS6329170.1 c-type cytochrome [Nitrospira sp.]CAE6760723.1 Putative Quinol-cytochrome c reductase, cytochrome c subunit [Nitrospira defluvii]